MNFSAIIALVAAVLLILASHRADGESMVSLLQPSAFMIVLGGTFCAAVVNFKPSTLMTALRSSVDVFLERQPSQIKVIDEIIYLAHQAKMKGLFYLNNLVDDIQDPFLKRGVQLSIDFNNPQMIYDILKAEISYDEEEELINSRVFEALGGYAPTFGIVGAVFGLIQIMGYIQQPDILAQGIAVAFVSTLYGVCKPLVLAGCRQVKNEHKRKNSVKRSSTTGDCCYPCLLYKSDAGGGRSSVVLVGRWSIK